MNQRASAAARDPRRTASRRWGGRLPALVLALALIVAACGPEGDEDAAVEPGESPEMVDIRGEAFGSELDDREITFILHDIECGIETLGEAEANGQFCIAEISVTNNGDEEYTLSATNQRLTAGSGRTYNAVGNPRVRRALESPVFEPLGPGETTEGAIAFDIPADQTVDSVRLRADSSSGGALYEVD